MIGYPSLNKWIVVALLCLANVIAYVDRTNLSVAIASKEFKDFFHLTDVQRGDLSSAFFWSYAFLQVPIGALSGPLRSEVAVRDQLSDLESRVCQHRLGDQPYGSFSHSASCSASARRSSRPAVSAGSGLHIDERQRGLAIGLFFAGAKLGPAIGAYSAALLIEHMAGGEMFIILGLGSLIWLGPWLLTAKDDDRAIGDRGEEGTRRRRMCLSGRCSRHPPFTGSSSEHSRTTTSITSASPGCPPISSSNWHMTKMEMGVFTAFSFTGMAVVAILAGTAGDRLIARGWDPIKVRKGFTIAGLAVASTEVIGVMSGSKDIALLFAIVSFAGLGLATANYWALTQSLMPGAAIGRITGVQNFASNMSGIVAPVVTGRLIAMTGSYEAPMQAILVILATGIAAYIFLVRPKYAPTAAKLVTA